MKRTIYVLCNVELWFSVAMSLLMVVLTIVFSWDASYAWGVVIAYAIIASLAVDESIQVRTRKPSKGLSIALIVVGNIFGRIAGIMALVISRDEYPPLPAPMNIAPSLERPPHGCTGN